MSDSTGRDAFALERLPDVRPARPGVSYTAFSAWSTDRAGVGDTVPPAEEPAWWEVDDVAQLPDARRWRAGSIINGHLPAQLRLALDGAGQGGNDRLFTRPLGADLDSILGGSRYGPDDPIPVWTDADTARERSSWRDEGGRGGTGRRAKRGKRDRQDRTNDRRRSSSPEK